MSANVDPPALDPELVGRVVGKRLLIGLTYVSYSGEVVEQEQLHGIVQRIDEHEGIVIELANGSEYRLPPDLRGMAPPGTHRLRSTGEEVENPDYLYAWTITQPGA